MSIALIQSLQSLAQAGLAYSKDGFDRQRFDAIQNIAAELLAAEGRLPQEQAAAIIFDEVGYRTPKVDVRGAVFEDGKILLVRERSDGLWCLPGGWADVNESPAEAVEREVWEETGLETRAQKLVAVHDTRRRGPKQYYHSYKLIFLCERQSGTITAQDETTDAGYFAPNEIPALSERRTTAELIDLLFVHHVQRNQPTTFD